MKVKYEIVRIGPGSHHRIGENSLDQLKDLLNDGYIIERVEEIHDAAWKGGLVEPYTYKDYILFKIVYDNENNGLKEDEE